MLLGTNPRRRFAQFYPQSERGIIKVALRRIERLRDRVDLVVRHKSLVTARHLVGLVRSVVSMELTLGPVSRLLCIMIFYPLNSGRSTLFWKESYGCIFKEGSPKPKLHLEAEIHLESE